MAADLRDRIVTGTMPPGSRLPTFVDLQREYNVNPTTVAHAIDRLKTEGFVETQGARGTFVASRPPHLHQYALLFPSHPAESGWSRFWAAMINEAATLEKEDRGTISFHYDVDGVTRDQNYHALVERVTTHRFAGLIFASKPFLVKDTPLLTFPGVPRVAVMDPPAEGEYPGLSTVTMDSASLVDKVLDHLVSKGRKRLAVITRSLRLPTTQRLVSEAQKRGITMHPYWQLTASPDAVDARNAAHLLFHPSQGERPDCLFVADDNFVEHATFGVADAGVSVPEDVEIVAHCNFPWPTPSAVPIKRVGFDVRDLLRSCVDAIDRQRRGEVLSTLTPIQAKFEEELAS